MNRIATAALLLSLSAFASDAQNAAPPRQQKQQEQKEYAAIHNFLRVDDQICTGGQPRMEDLEKMKSQGIKAVINLRQASEYDAEAEAAKTKEMGLRYIHIPVNGRDVKDEQVAEFLRATSDPANRPAFIHCASANRVGAFWMIRRVLADGWKIEDAEAEARKIGTRSETLVAFAKDYIQRHKP